MVAPVSGRLRPAGVSHQATELVGRVAQPLNQLRADETRPSSDKDLHHRLLSADDAMTVESYLTQQRLVV